jgi:hypothetical protein
VSTIGAEIDRLVDDLAKPTSGGKLFMFVYPPAWERRVGNSLKEISTRICSSGRRAQVIDINALVNVVIAGRLADLSSAWVTDRSAATAYVREKSIVELLRTTKALDAPDSALFWTRVGGAYPFFRVASVSEQLIARLEAPLVVFYPGALEGKTHFALLGKSDGYQYRFDYYYSITEAAPQEIS